MSQSCLPAASARCYADNADQATASVTQAGVAHGASMQYGMADLGPGRGMAGLGGSSVAYTHMPRVPDAIHTRPLGVASSCRR